MKKAATISFVHKQPIGFGLWQTPAYWLAEAEVIFLPLLPEPLQPLLREREREGENLHFWISRSIENGRGDDSCRCLLGQPNTGLVFYGPRSSFQPTSPLCLPRLRSRSTPQALHHLVRVICRLISSFLLRNFTNGFIIHQTYK